MRGTGVISSQASISKVRGLPQGVLKAIHGDTDKMYSACHLLFDLSRTMLQTLWMWLTRESSRPANMHEAMVLILNLHKLGVVVQACNLQFLNVEARRVMSSGISLVYIASSSPA